jgi:hypothetical protein
VLTVNGRIRVRRIRWHDSEEGSQTPVDAWLDEAESTISQGVREMACRLNQGSTSFEKTSENLLRAAHVQISKEQLRQVIESEGKSVLGKMRRGELIPNWSAEDCRTADGTTRVYLGCDGVRVPLVTDDEKRKRRSKIREKRARRGRKCKPLPRLKGGADQSYKEFRIAVLYDESQKRRYVSGISGNHEAAGRMMRRMGLEIDLAKATEKIANVDGAPWIRNQIELHGLVDAIGLDYFHLRDNVQKSRRIVFGEDSEDGKQWADALMSTFYTEGYDRAWDEVADWRRPLRGRKRDEAGRLLSYVTERKEMIRYPEFKEKGWQIGSGPTEAQCKTSTSRLKGRGRRWDADNAEAVMALDCLESSRAWASYWTTPDPERN